MEMTKFAITDVATIFVIGPIPTGIISRGKSMRFTQKIPNGGIQAVLRICSTVTVDCDTYSMHALQKMVRPRLKRGATIQPRRAKSICESDGIYRLIPKLNRVSMIP
jgi:hypothetical protein